MAGYSLGQMSMPGKEGGRAVDGLLGGLTLVTLLTLVIALLAYPLSTQRARIKLKCVKSFSILKPLG